MWNCSRTLFKGVIITGSHDLLKNLLEKGGKALNIHAKKVVIEEDGLLLNDDCFLTLSNCDLMLLQDSEQWSPKQPASSPTFDDDSLLHPFQEESLVNNSETRNDDDTSDSDTRESNQDKSKPEALFQAKVYTDWELGSSHCGQWNPRSIQG